VPVLSKNRNSSSLLLSEGAEALKGRQFLRLVGFFKGFKGVGIWNREREGDALMQFHLSIEKTDRFGFGYAEAVKDFYRLLFEASIYAGVDAIGHGHV
jgi:hypothetical protein